MLRSIISRERTYLCMKRWKSTKVQEINKVLIANRGEIACRVIKTARKLGIKTVAIYSDADKNALHTQMADEAYRIGEAPAAQSYLLGDKILQLAQQSKCQAIHPGYGFLSENVEFAEKCQKSPVIFMGPSADCIRAMGVKSTSKAIMTEAGVPTVRGYHGADQSDAYLLEQADSIGYPVMIKAVRGGGGKGMRIALHRDEFMEQLKSARTESERAFGDSAVLIEEFVQDPRHVEVQVFGDCHGNVVHLFERDCSVQRRHQKIIEEAPAPGLSSETRVELGRAAVLAAKSINYVGAGTVEFMLDRHTHKFHFMEMNTRLQVEHPITECITNTDLVEWQFLVAQGHKLPLTQDEIKCSGHAIEARVYAENPAQDFSPCAGPIKYLSTPSSALVRIDSGIRQNDAVTVHYDPMIAKVVAYAASRQQAVLKLHSALEQYHVAGLDTNVSFLMQLLRHDAFKAAAVHTNFIRDHRDTLLGKTIDDDCDRVKCVVAKVLLDSAADCKDLDPFVLEGAFRPNYAKEELVRFKDFAAIVSSTEDGYKVKLQDKLYRVEADLEQTSNGSLVLNCTIDGVRTKTGVYANEDNLTLFTAMGKLEFGHCKPKHLSSESGDLMVGSGGVTAPMPGIVDSILVKGGQLVKSGDALFVLVAMKMEHVVRANQEGRIAAVHCRPGDSVAKGAHVVRFAQQDKDQI